MYSYKTDTEYINKKKFYAKVALFPVCIVVTYWLVLSSSFVPEPLKSSLAPSIFPLFETANSRYLQIEKKK